jgi:hypothetical protein
MLRQIPGPKLRCCGSISADSFEHAEQKGYAHSLKLGDLGKVMVNMNSSDLAQPAAAERRNESRQTYVAPACRRLTPEAAKELLMQKGDLSDPEVQRMLQCIEELQKRNNSESLR